MKRTTVAAILVLATISPAAQANEVARIQSAPGQSQAAWISTPEYQAFQCPVGTLRGGGVDMNYTTTQNDDYYFTNCYEAPQPIPVITPSPAPIVTPPDTSTVTATITPIQITPPTSSSVGASETTTAKSAIVATETSTTAATLTTSAAFDYQAFLQMFIAWFQTWFTQFLMNWGK